MNWSRAEFGYQLDEFLTRLEGMGFSGVVARELVVIFKARHRAFEADDFVTLGRLDGLEDGPRAVHAREAVGQDAAV